MTGTAGHHRRVAVFFHFFEANEDYRDNLVFFLSAAYLEEADFFIILASDCSVSLPERDNITYIRSANRNRDFGGYVEALSGLKTLSDYDVFIFVNSSVRGPFLPARFSGHWTRLFTDLLSDDVRLVGSSINILSDASRHAKRFRQLFEFPSPPTHVQTTAYALDRTALKHLLDIGFYDVTESLERDDVISRYEIRMSQEILKRGWDIKCFLPEYNEIDYRRPHHNINHAAKMGDVVFRDAYFARTPHPSELVFVKTNRNVLSEIALASHTYTALKAGGKQVDDWDEARRLRERAFERVSAFVRRKKRWMRLLGLSGLDRFQW